MSNTKQAARQVMSAHWWWCAEDGDS